MIDVVSGSAGAIPVLLNVGKTYGRDDLIDLAHRHGEHLIRHAQRQHEGVSWDTVQVPVTRHLLGHAHGVAGIVTALLELHVVSGAQKYLDCALDGLRYEDQFLIQKYQNWPDFRLNEKMQSEPDASTLQYPLVWCHGAPGIGLSRIRSHELLSSQYENYAGLKSQIESDISAALISTAQSLQLQDGIENRNFSLCHGICGNAELMIVAGQKLQRHDCMESAEEIGRQGVIWGGRQSKPWPCGIPGAGQTPNLMLGTAGIGYFYLRLYDPDTVPSILIVMPSASFN